MDISEYSKPSGFEYSEIHRLFWRNSFFAMFLNEKASIIATYYRVHDATEAQLSSDTHGLTVKRNEFINTHGC